MTTDATNTTPQPDQAAQARSDIAHLLASAAAAMRVAEDQLQLAAVIANRVPSGLDLALDIALVLSEQHETTLKVQNGADAIQRHQF